MRSLNTVPKCSSGTVTTMLVQGSSSCTSASLRAFETPSEIHEERDGSEVTLPRVREVTDTWTFWTGNTNKGSRGLRSIGDEINIMLNQKEQVFDFYCINFDHVTYNKNKHATCCIQN